MREAYLIAKDKSLRADFMEDGNLITESNVLFYNLEIKYCFLTYQREEEAQENYVHTGSKRSTK